MDPTLQLRQAIVSTLKADAGVLAQVGDADRVFGERSLPTPVFPFIRYGITDARPARGQCWDGATIDLPIHAFSKADHTDEAAAMNQAIAAALDGKALALAGGITAHVQWRGSTIIPDGAEAGVYHGIVRFQITTA